MDPFSFAGGLSQTDWFSLGTGAGQTAAGMAAYNQQGYLPAVQMRQNQLYQEKNYHLSWVSVARDDIRSMMQASTNRMANYVLVGTLILQIAVGMLFQDSFGKGAPDFVTMAFWFATAISVMFLTSSVVYSVKGQNNAFLETMRLLTWEVRPENPAAYDFDYMKQLSSFEHHGWREILRMPGMKAHYEDDVSSEAPSSHRGQVGKEHHGPSKIPRPCPVPAVPEAAPHQERQGDVEVLQPDTRELLYLERFGMYMQLWMTYDTHSKYCIGLGLISMAHASTFWCLGRLSSNSRNMSDFIACMMMAIFSYMCAMVYGMNFRHKPGVAQIVMYILFLMGPVLGFLGVVLPENTWQPKLLRCLFMASNSWLYTVGFMYSAAEGVRPSKLAEKFTIGPGGERFTAGTAAVSQRRRRLRRGHRDSSHWDADVESHDGSSSDENSSDESSSDGGSSRRGCCAPTVGSQRGARDLGALGEDHGREDFAAREVHRKVSTSFRAQMALAAGTWVCATFAAALGQFSMLGLWAARLTRPDVTRLAVEALPVTWPSPSFSPGALACARGTVFAANAFQVVQLDLASGRAAAVPCAAANVTIRDLTLDCSSGACQPLALLSSSRVVNCATGAELPLLGGLLDAEKLQKLSLWQGPLDTLDNSSLMVLRDGRFVQSRWRGAAPGLPGGGGGWAPLWDLGTTQRIVEMGGRGGCPSHEDAGRLASLDDGPEGGDAAATPARRLRPIHGLAGGGATSSGGNRIHRNTRRINGGIVQTSGRSFAWTSGDAAEEAEAADVTVDLRNFAYEDAGLYTFSTVTSPRGWVEHNVISLFSVPDLDILREWHVEWSAELVAGCAVSEKEVLILENHRNTRVLRGFL